MQGSSNSIPRPPKTPGDAAVRYAERFRNPPVTRTEQNTRTATLKQLADACKENKHGGRFVLTNSQLYTVRVCGRLVGINQEDGYTNFVMDDGTAVVSGRIQSYHMDGHTDLTGSLLGAYYTVIANISTNKGEIELQALKAWRVVNHNEVTLHFLTAIHECYDLGNIRVVDLDRWGVEETKAAKYAQTRLNNEINKEAIVCLLSKEHVRRSDEGAAARYIFEELHMDESEGRSTLASMLDEGSIYNTIDYEHYKMADEI